MQDTLIERAADRIFDLFEDRDWMTGDRAEAMARAAIEAVREPTEAMALAVSTDLCAWECFKGNGEQWQPADVWRAMIDAALAEELAPAPTAT